MDNINTKKRNNYWENFAIESSSTDYVYHLAGADKSVNNPGESIKPFHLLHYYYRFLLEGKLFEHIFKYLPNKHKTALDAGCGTGRTAVILAEFFDKVDAFDLSEDFIEENKRRFKNEKINFYVSDINSLSQVDEKYDLVFLGGVFMCLSDTEVIDALGNIRKILNNDGLLMLRDTISKKETKVINEVKIIRSEEDYEKLFKQSGLEFVSRFNGANRNMFCSTFNRMPLFIQKNKTIFEFFKLFIKVFIIFDLKKLIKRNGDRHPLSNQLFYIYKK